MQAVNMDPPTLNSQLSTLSSTQPITRRDHQLVISPSAVSSGGVADLGRADPVILSTLIFN